MIMFLLFKNADPEIQSQIFETFQEKCHTVNVNAHIINSLFKIVNNEVSFNTSDRNYLKLNIVMIYLSSMNFNMFWTLLKRTKSNLMQKQLHI